MSNIIQIEVGQKFGRLTVLRRSPIKARNALWECKCDCGNIVNVRGSHLKYGETTSCGCYQKEKLAERSKTHGETKTRLYHIWDNIKYRCYKVGNDHYKNYGARGITVCEEWRDSFETFKEWAVNNGYNEKLTIDRKNNNGNYEPNNCRWVDRKTQMRNTRGNHYITIGNKTKIIEQWAEENNINPKTLRSRLRNGFCKGNVLKISKGRGCSSYIKD